jgi:hypothetical protein
MVRAAALALALIAAPAAAAADRFDLVCKGSTITETAEGKRSEPFERRYRIDLGSARWCQEDCGVVRPIAEVQEAYLRLEPRTTHRDGTTEFEAKIDRTSGAETVIFMGDRSFLYFTQTDASCKPAPFSGFPTLKKVF